jgi:hypothetical protein
VRGEQHLGSGLLLDLWGVAMIEQAVRSHVLVHRAEHRGVLQGAAGAADTGDRVDDHAGRLDHAGLDQWRQRQRGGRDVASGGRHHRGFLEVLAMQLRQPEHGLGQQLGLIMGEPVPSWIQRGVLQAERRGQVDDAADLAVQLRGQRHRCLVRQTEKDHVETNGPRRVELFEDQVGVACRQARVQAAGQSSGLAVTRGVDHLEVRMLGAQTKQLGSRVARCTDDADSFHDA